MLRVWQKRLLDNRPVVYYEYTSGTHEINLPTGRYEITLVGRGGLSNYVARTVSLQPTITYEVFSAQGGIGGTAVAVLNVTGNPTITVHVGDSDSNDTYIEGIAGFTLRAGGGSDASVTSSTSGTAGVMGTNTMTGSFISLESNTNIITSKTSYQSRTQQIPRNFFTLFNPNYAPDTTKGSAGLSNIRGQGLVIIKAI